MKTKVIPGLRPLLVKVESLREDPENVFRHPDGAVEQLRKSLEALGQHKPLVVQRNGMVVRIGNMTLRAAKQLGWTHVAAVLVTESEALARRRAIADNRIPQLSGFDDDALASMLRTLGEAPEDLDGMGFSEEELIEIFGANGSALAPRDEVVPEPPKNPVTKPGDVWELGGSRVACVDSTDHRRMSGLLSGPKVQCVFTDAPYGVGYEKTVQGRQSKTRQISTIANDEVERDRSLEMFLRESFHVPYEATAPGGAWYVCCPSGPQFMAFLHASREWWKQTLVWLKDRVVLGRSDFLWMHEFIVYGWKPGASHRAPKTRKEKSVWEFPKPHSSELHPTMKPIELVSKALGISTRKGELVCDPLLGSGTTLIAAYEGERHCRGAELSPGYCDVIVERWKAAGGTGAKRKKGALS